MEKTKSIFDRVYTILVDEAQADERLRFAFVRYHSERHNPSSEELWNLSEWRFCGVLGQGGKFWVHLGSFYVNYYKEDDTSARKKMTTRLNSLIHPLALELYDYCESHAKPGGDEG